MAKIFPDAAAELLEAVASEMREALINDEGDVAFHDLQALTPKIAALMKEVRAAIGSAQAPSETNEHRIGAFEALGVR